MSKAFLIIAAHPDDEVLGAGATMYKMAQEGYSVNVCILSEAADARYLRPKPNELKSNMYSCMRVLGVEKVITGDFPNIQFNTVPHLELVQFIENAIVETQAEVVITHHPADLNNDHFHTSLACQAAVRLFQRRTGIKPLKELLFMEVPSSTEWRLNTGFNQFNPNTYVEVDEIGIEKKIEALSQYQGVMREFPHPRCAEVLWGLAAYRGGQAGMRYAEAFESVFRRGL